MEVDIEEVETTLTMTEEGDLLDGSAMERIVAITTRRVLQELARQQRRRRARAGSSRIDPDRY